MYLALHQLVYLPTYPSSFHKVEKTKAKGANFWHPIINSTPNHIIACITQHQYQNDINSITDACGLRKGKGLWFEYYDNIFKSISSIQIVSISAKIYDFRFALKTENICM